MRAKGGGCVGSACGKDGRGDAGAGFLPEMAGGEPGRRNGRTLRRRGGQETGVRRKNFRKKRI